LFTALAALRGIEPRPSRANFILFRVEGPAARARSVHAALARIGVRVRDVGGLAGLAGWLRVTVGAPEENDAFVTALAEALDGCPP
jgi:histidinol-phosphate/aromatic aminotransferase/cobyric acid decarboxylase-like protein